MAFVQNYLKNTEDTSSLTTGTSDDGIGTHSAPSDFASEEPSGKNKIFFFNINNNHNNTYFYSVKIQNAYLRLHNQNTKGIYKKII